MSDWVDRLAVETTRRQGLKALFGAVVLALPFGRSEHAHASHTTSEDCEKGCLWTADGTYRRQKNRCHEQWGSTNTLGLIQGLYNPALGAVTLGAGLVSGTACHERARLVKKATSYDCLQPGCPGFDPDAPGGPCEPCTQTPRCKCCTDPASPIGYTYYDVDHPCPN